MSRWAWVLLGLALAGCSGGGDTRIAGSFSLSLRFPSAADAARAATVTLDVFDANAQVDCAFLRWAGRGASPQPPLSTKTFPHPLPPGARLPIIAEGVTPAFFAEIFNAAGELTLRGCVIAEQAIRENLSLELIVPLAIPFECVDDGDCPTDTTCAEADGSRVCECTSGLRRVGNSCEDIPACDAQPCFPMVTCEDIPAPNTGYRCGDCPRGYEGDGETCTDIDGCAQTPCAANVTCTDRRAPQVGRDCGECPPGFEGDGATCGDINECEAGDHNCPTALECINLNGGFKCAATLLCGDVPCPMEGVPSGNFFRGCRAEANDCQDDEDNGDGTGNQVTLSAYLIDRSEVTVAQYTACVNGGGCPREPGRGSGCNYAVTGRGDHPVNCVDHAQAESFCAWADKRLPTEAEWEKAARGPGARKYPWGDAEPDCTRAVLENGVGDGCGVNRTAEICSRSPRGDSPYGLCDMAGNIQEWVADWYEGNYYVVAPELDPPGPERSETQLRITRGGSWVHDAAGFFRTARRNKAAPDLSNREVGFRCARDR